ncbi:hypothetical protein HG536_0E01310 [Torulaspora globosa]|uniref:Uncharacterized protein n=1 Tax=Torulaspora globosa TaxID=48254 RepID=A0A7G3ZI84_9SACH|nr:uncharacterized protein HG536_0E01310 [Torulaspora globosa]QLL33220.1 hypothetical protein HG536_0E01310 [Torulaspora globosa]
MAVQVSPSQIGPLSRSGEEDSDANEIYYSLQERDASDGNESFYSVRDQDVEDEDAISIKGSEIAGDEGARERTFVGETDTLEANMAEVANESELSDFFSDYHHGSEVKSAKKGPGWFTAQSVLESKRSPAPVELRDDSSKDNKEPFESSRSPSVMMTRKCRPPGGIEAKVDEIEIIELDDCIEERDELIDCDIASNDIEVFGPDSSCVRELPFVEFDGYKKVIIIASDDEADDRPDDEKKILAELTDWVPKRDRSPEAYEPTTDELHQSPVQRKMKKLIELAQKAEKMPGS